ncbi:MAG: hypothetical protein Q9227_000339 [Pyrenula ochraceoflavens]
MAKFGLAASTHDGGTKALTAREHLLQWQENFDRESLLDNETSDGQNLVKPNHLSKAELSVDTSDGISFRDSTQSLDETDSNVEEDTEQNSGLDLEPHGSWRGYTLPRAGDLLIVLGGGSADNASFQAVIYAKGDSLIVYNPIGRWALKTLRYSRFIMYRVPMIFSQEAIDQVLPYIPKEAFSQMYLNDSDLEGEIPRNMGAPILNILHSYHEQAASFTHRHATKLETVWDRLADNAKSLELTMGDISKTLFDIPEEKLTHATRFALFCALNRDPMKITATFQGQYRGLVFHVESKEKVRAVETVISWGRRFQKAALEAANGSSVDKEMRENPLAQFIPKARRAILQSRAHRSPTVMSALGPSSYSTASAEDIEVELGVKFSDSDRFVLEFLMFACGARISYSVTVQSVATTIQRAIGAYPEMLLGVSTGRLLLQELGIFPPWLLVRDLNPYDKVAGLGVDADLDAMLEETRQLAKSNADQCNSDMSTDIRIDWGDLAAFCIDSASTVDHDDAFSLERNAGCDKTWWLRVHIADPAAFIAPEHPFARFAEECLQNLYHTERVVHMLPPNWSTERFSIAPDRPVLTMSMLMNEEGEILETDIKPGRIHNVVHATPAALWALLGYKLPSAFVLRIGDGPRHHQDADSTDNLRVHQETLKQAEALVSAFHNRKDLKLNRFMMTQAPTCNSSVSTTPVPPFKLNQHVSHSRVFKGDPSIELTSSPSFWTNANPAETDLVSMIMLLANEAVAGWCRVRGIPIPYSTCLWHPDFPLDKLMELPETETVVMPLAKLSVEPGPYENLPAEQYTRVTSPLRRYFDLLVHWQIHSVLRFEANGKKFDAADDMALASLPFPKNQIQNLIDKQEFVSIMQTRSKKRNTSYWSLLALFRALHFQQGQLPEIFYLPIKEEKAIATSETLTETGLRGRALPFAVPARLMRSEEGFEKGLEVGDVVPCKLLKVHIDALECHMVPLGPPMVASFLFENHFREKSLDFTMAEYERLHLAYQKALR